MKRLIYRLKNEKILSLINKAIYKTYIDLFKGIIVGTFFRIFPIKKNKIVVCSYHGKGYGDNGKAIIDELLKLDKEEKLNIIWALNKDNYNTDSLPKRVKKVKYESYRHLYDLVTSKVWIDNSRKLFGPIKRKKQFYIQTWHGGIGLKKVEKSALDSISLRYIRKAKKDSKYADLFISNCSLQTQIYKDDFWYNGEILEIGIPRNDILINKNTHNEIKEKVFKELNISINYKIVIYAPTFRKNENLKAYNIDFEKLLTKLNEYTGENWKCLIRLHPNITEKSSNISFNNHIIDVSKYPDLYNLMIASDMLITDYSSLMFDYSYLKKPIFLYASDIKEYLDDRGFAIDLNELPFSISKSNKELFNNIKNFDKEQFTFDVENFYKKVGLKETGQASFKIAEIIYKKCQ